MAVKTSKRASSDKIASPEQPKQLILNPYESVLILKATLTDEEVDVVLEKVKALIEEKGGEIVSSDNWGKKKLAYEVQKERRGIYIVMHFKGTSATIIELERIYRFSESIIKFMNIRIEAADLGKSQPIKEDKAFSYKGAASGRGWK